MEYLIGLILIAIVLYILSRSSNAPQHKAQSSAQEPRSADDELEWLHERWKLADDHQRAGRDDIFPSWYFDAATEPQKRLLKELGIKTGKAIAKGQASDLIGIHEPEDEQELAILKFFKRPTKGMNETKARHEIAQLMADPENAKAWENRPPTKEQREFCKFFGIKMGKGTTSPEAEKLIAEYETMLDEQEDPRLDEWEAFSEIMDELSDSDARADYEIKKPSLTLIRSAMDELGQDGKSYREVADDIDDLVDKLLELKPDLQRR